MPCGHATNHLVIGGRPAIPGEFPHMALIGYQGSSDDFEFLCGGSIISENFVLSAGLCLHKSSLQHQ